MIDEIYILHYIEHFFKNYVRKKKKFNNKQVQTFQFLRRKRYFSKKAGRYLKQTLKLDLQTKKKISNNLPRLRCSQNTGILTRLTVSFILVFNLKLYHLHFPWRKISKTSKLKEEFRKRGKFKTDPLVNTSIDAN